MSEIKIFRCGLCKKENRRDMTRKGLREHLKKEHRIMSEIKNRSGKGKKKIKQNWWIEE